MISPHKDKIRIVFDCSVSLNDHVLKGPDLTNLLTAVLIRFREYKVAIVGDIEAMYHQCIIPLQERDMLQFLWTDRNESNPQLVEYRMRVHVFGGIWSGSAANYCLKKAAADHETELNTEAAESIRRDFYVDDWIKSVDDPQHAIKLMKDVKAILIQSGFKLTKFMSNDRQIVKMIPEEERGKPLLNIDLDKQELPRDRALGVKWDLNTDEFFYEPKKIDKPFTRRGMISIISSLFDPLGFASPVIVVAKMIFQEVTKLKLPWDEQVPEVNSKTMAGLV